jgi:hypothetical protein
VVFALILLWYAAELRAGRAATWLARPWYRRKAAPSFADVLATLRQQGLATATWAAAQPRPQDFPVPACPHQPRRKPHPLRHLTRAA